MDNQVKKKKVNKKVIFIIIIVALLALVAFRITTSKNAPAPQMAAEKSINVKVTQAEKKDLQITSPLSGRIQPVDEAAIVPLVSGKITDVYVSLGTKVSVGTPLFELDKEQMQNAYDQALASYNQAHAAYTNAKSDFERIKLLYEEEAVSKQQYEQAQLQYSTASQTLTQAQSTLNNAKDNLENCVVTSPINGYVTLININAGEIASQASAAVVVANIDTVEIETSISENLINKINIGDSVKVLVKSASDQAFDGTISELSPAPAQGSLTYPLKVSIDNKDTLIKSGMFAEVRIVSERKDNVLAVPSDAVIIKNGEAVVAVVEDDHSVFKKVEVGIDNNQYVEIVEGLNEGDQIIYEGQYYLDEGSQVTVIN